MAGLLPLLYSGEGGGEGLRLRVSTGRELLTVRVRRHYRCRRATSLRMNSNLKTTRAMNRLMNSRMTRATRPNPDMKIRRMRSLRKVIRGKKNQRTTQTKSFLRCRVALRMKAIPHSGRRHVRLILNSAPPQTAPGQPIPKPVPIRRRETTQPAPIPTVPEPLIPQHAPILLVKTPPEMIPPAPWRLIPKPANRFARTRIVPIPTALIALHVHHSQPAPRAGRLRFAIPAYRPGCCCSVKSPCAKHPAAGCTARCPRDSLHAAPPRSAPLRRGLLPAAAASRCSIHWGADMNRIDSCPQNSNPSNSNDNRRCESRRLMNGNPKPFDHLQPGRLG